MTDARISAASVTAGHDGSAELVVRVRHPNGGEDTVTLDAVQAERLLDRCGAQAPSALVGQSWQHLMFVLEAPVA